MNRRPYRSFRLTRRRDYVRGFKIEGYWSFTNRVRRVIWQQKWLFGKFVAIYSIFSVLILGITSQKNYRLLSDTLHDIGGGVFGVQLGDFTTSLAIFSGVISGAISGQLSESQQIYAGLLFLLGWLTIVWLLRQLLAGHRRLKLRDGVYASGAPIVPTFLLFMVVLVQLLPLIVALVAYATVQSLNILGATFFSLLFWLVELLLSVVSLYWLSSTVMALVIVTLPGMYPLKALRAAGDLVRGRRLRILYRLAWLFLILLGAWLAVLLPIILIAEIAALKQLPLVPISVLLLSSTSLVYAASYIYLLYRKLVDDASA